MFNVSCHSLFAATNDERCDRWHKIIDSTESRINKLARESATASESDSDVIDLEKRFLINLHHEFMEEFTRVCVI